MKPAFDGRVIAAVVNGELPVHVTGHRIHTLHACPSIH